MEMDSYFKKRLSRGRRVRDFIPPRILFFTNPTTSEIYAADNMQIMYPLIKVEEAYD